MPEVRGRIEEASLPMLIGEAPSRGGDRFYSFPLSGRPARVLCEMAGIPPLEDGSTYGRWTWALYERFECVNLFLRYKDATPWSAPAARKMAKALIVDGWHPEVVVLLGKKVSAAVFSALELPQPDPYQWVELDFGMLSIVQIPHPSGLNRVLNDEAERARSGEILREAMSRAGRER